MAVSVAEQTAGRCLVLAPHEALVGGGAAEEFEARVQVLFREGFRHLVADLRTVPTIDSAGIRALVRGHTTAQRLNGSFRLAAPNERVRTMLRLARLESVLESFETIEQARARVFRWDILRFALGGAALCGGLVWLGTAWPEVQQALPSADPFASTPAMSSLGQPLLQLVKLIAAALIGLLVTVVHRHYRADRPQTQSMDQAQVLLCVSGAMMMIIIGNSLARAFGIAGAASIVRFRTPVDDPKDITILFLLMGLGMAAGLGAFAVAGLGTLFLCVMLAALEALSAQRARTILVEITAEGRDFPSAHVQSVFARNRIVFEPREVSQGKEAAVEYQATLNPTASLEDVSAQLMAAGCGVKEVSWQPVKRPI
jgi:anti-anti-sigma factor